MKVSAAAESLVPHIVGQGRLGFWLLCSAIGCYSKAYVSCGRHSTSNEKQKLKVAQSFVQRGWTCPRYPLCPDCSREDPVAAVGKARSMVGLQISVNGEPLTTVAVGQPSTVKTGMDWAFMPQKTGQIWVRISAQECNADGVPVEELYGHNRGIMLGDEVSVKVVEFDG